MILPTCNNLGPLTGHGKLCQPWNWESSPKWSDTQFWIHQCLLLLLPAIHIPPARAAVFPVPTRSTVSWRRT